ncbi:MAG: FAD-binding oxidoreductase [Gammaproteobacteria bacterium]|nr:FAD-binding oxidoreductase [Gammaproteobacteria bacterium]
MDAELLEQLKEIVGEGGWRKQSEVDPKYYEDWMGARAEVPALLLRPADTEQVSQILAACHRVGQPIAPQGGMTGLVSAAAPHKDEVAMCFDRMKQIQDVDIYTATMTVEAGAELQTIQERAQEAGMFFPLDVGARGSCTAGGNLSTNAGGNRVVRFGMMRDLVLGVEAVLADGQVINGLNKLRKNNTGYDLKQLFIGSEGTLGVITRAVLKLSPTPTSQNVAFCAVENFDEVASLQVYAQASLGSNLSAFEVLWHNTYQLIDEKVPHVKVPLPTNFPFYVLMESMGSSKEKDTELFLEVLEGAAEKGIIADTVVADSDAKVQSLWMVRDAAAEVMGVGYMHTFDVSLKVQDMGYFGEEVEKRLRQQWPQAVIGLFGHIADGNVHIIVNVGPQTRSLHREIDEVVYRLIQELNGSVSAEHGIGIMKKEYLSYSRSEEEITLMKTLKYAMDPKNILSPGRIFL